MAKNTPDVTGWLQDVASLANEILNGLHDGSLPDNASTFDDEEIEQSLKHCFDDLERYKRACCKAHFIEAYDGPTQAERM